MVAPSPAPPYVGGTPKRLRNNARRCFTSDQSRRPIRPPSYILCNGVGLVNAHPRHLQDVTVYQLHFRGRPACFPCVFTRLRPPAVRVRIRSRSTSAKPPRTAIISRPVLVPVSAHGSARRSLAAV